MIERGDLVRRPELGRLFRQLASNGSDAAFYDPQGAIAQSLAHTAQLYGGILSPEDFGAYSIDVKEGLSTKIFDRYSVFVPNSGLCLGAAILGGLHVMLKEYDDKNLSWDMAAGKDLEPKSTQRLAEAMKWMGAARSKLGDALLENEQTALNERIEEILSDAWAEGAYANISEEHTLSSWRDYHPDYLPVEDNGTAHFSVVDRYGNAVAMTTSVNLVFGSLLVDNHTGILLNDQMDDFLVPQKSNAFDLVPSLYNYIKSGKRPLSLMVPVIVTDKDGLPDLVIGAAGGSRIYTSVFQALVRRYLYKMKLLETIAFPRLHHQLLPEILYMENFTNIENDMKKRGHKVEVQEARSVMNGISREDGLLAAVSDWWRKHGVASAY